MWHGAVVGPCWGDCSLLSRFAGVADESFSAKVVTPAGSSVALFILDPSETYCKDTSFFVTFPEVQLIFPEMENLFWIPND